MKTDLLLKNGRVFNAYLKKFILADTAVKDGKFFYIGPVGEQEFEAAEVRDLQGMCVIPGLIDCHMHIESSMMVPSLFSDAVIPNGVTTVIAEPHEIANVFGMRGIRAMIGDASRCLLDVKIAVPSSVPSTNADLETTGAEIGIPETAELLQDPSVVCLGEVMNYVDVIRDPDCKSSRIIQYVKEHRPLYPIEGHCPRITGTDLSQFVYSGVDSDHTEQTLEGMKERIADGVFIQLQEKSLKKELLSYIDENGLEDRMAFVTDDTMPDALLQRGHLNYIVKTAMALGYPPEKAIYDATFTPAQRMRLFDRGAVAPGKIADFLIIRDIRSMDISEVWKNGCRAWPRRNSDSAKPNFPEEFRKSVHVSVLSESDFRIPAPIRQGKVLCRTAVVKEDTTATEEGSAWMPVRDGYVVWEDTPYCLTAVIERHGKNGDRGFLFTGGTVMQKGAAASTYAHDHHNLLVIGRSGKDMAAAANSVIGMQGGYSVCCDGQIIGQVRLPIAGILSDRPVEELGREVATVREGLRSIGFRNQNTIMSISTLGLPVSPAVKVTDKGIVDVQKQQLVPLFLDCKDALIK